MARAFGGLLAGGVLTTAFAPFSLFPLAWLAVAALFALWRDATPRQAALIGFCFGLGHYGSGIYWVVISLHTYGNAPFLFALLAMLLLVFYMALYPAILGYALRRLVPGSPVLTWLVVAPAAWVALEWLRSWMLSGFPWLSLGYSQIDGPLAGFAAVGGVFTVSAVTVTGSGLLLLGVEAVHGRSPSRAVIAALALSGFCLSGYGLGQISWTEPAGEPVRVTLIQGNIEQDRKFRPELRERTLQVYTGLSLDAAADSDLIIWPETAIPEFFSELDPAFIDNLDDHARLTETDYLTGVPAGDWRNGEYYNGVVSFGATRGFYYKHRLLPFGEYLPIRWLFNLFHHFVDIPMADFTAGKADQAPLQVAGHPVGVSICFEAAFGSEIRQVLPQAHFLVNVSNDGWFGNSLAPHQHLEMVRMRALESNRPIARATNTGVTALIDERGRVIARGPQFELTTVKGLLQPQQGSTPYVLYGDLPVVLLCGTTLAVLVVVSVPRRVR